MNDLTLVIPAKNEWLSLPRVLDELQKYNYKILVILHESDKKTIKSIKNYRHKIIKQKSQGYGNAILKGMNSVKTKYFCIFNADGSFNPNDIALMLKKIKLGYHFIFASRYLSGGGSEDDTIVTFVGNKLFTLIGQFFFKLRLSDILFTFIVGETTKFKKLNLSYNDFRFCVEMPIKIKRNNFKYSSIPSFEKLRMLELKMLMQLKMGF